MSSYNLFDIIVICNKRILRNVSTNNLLSQQQKKKHNEYTKESLVKTIQLPKQTIQRNSTGSNSAIGGVLNVNHLGTIFCKLYLHDMRQHTYGIERFNSPKVVCRPQRSFLTRAVFPIQVLCTVKARHCNANHACGQTVVRSRSCF